MSSSATTSKAGATFLWVLAAFASFAVLFYLIQVLFATQGVEDPRIPARLANKEEILKAQNEIIAKMGLNDSSKKAAIFAKTLEVLKAKPEGVSAQVVPGSPTQLKQAAAPAPEAAPAAAPSTPETIESAIPATSSPVPAAEAPTAPAPAPAVPGVPPAPDLDSPTPAPANAAPATPAATPPSAN